MLAKVDGMCAERDRQRREQSVIRRTREWLKKGK